MINSSGWTAGRGDTDNSRRYSEETLSRLYQGMAQMKIPGVFKPYVVIFRILDGYGQLWSPSGQFLGLLSSDLHHPYSIINPLGNYGSPHSSTSIHNPQSLYGGANGIYSPYNPDCLNPPIILYQGDPVLIVTWNLNVFTNDLNIVDADLMLAIYEQFSNSISQSRNKRSQSTGSAQSQMLDLALQHLTRAIQNSEMPIRYASFI
ncbi:MAG TPA: hypothetical protein V6C85_19855 [Allocoleopsis sp.]